MKLAIGFITYGEITAKYLPYFLLSLKNQDLDDFKIMAIDNSEEKENNNIRYLRKYNIDYEWTGENVGFARAYNRMIKQAVAAGAKYFLAINPDMIVESGAIKEMLQALDADKNLASVSPKILRWDFKNKRKTSVIDTCGIIEASPLRFFDLGQGEEDKGQYNRAEIIGPSGAAAMYRVSALEAIKEKNNYFDELMFMYKEDCDLAYRLKLSGFKSKCAPGAIFYHDRTAAAKGKNYLSIALNRRNKSRQVKKWSFFGQQYIFLKYWHKQNWRGKLNIILYEAKALIFCAIFEPYLLKEFFRVFKMRK